MPGRLWRVLLAGLVLLLAGGCSDELIPVPGTTTRVSKPVAAEGTELELKIFTTAADCVGADVAIEDIKYCLPRVDRASGEVRIGYQFRLNSSTYFMPPFKEQLQISHQGTQVQDGQYGQAYTIIPHDPNPVRQVYVVVIDGSSSMAEDNRMKKVKQALLLDDVKDAFFPVDPKTGETVVKTGVVLLQFTQGAPVPVGGKLEILLTRLDYVERVKSLQVVSGYTHLFDAITYATGELLKQDVIDYAIETEEMAVTVVALTDGFNNLRREDTCRDNAERLSTLLRHLQQVREGEGIDLRRRPTVFTVGLGRPLRPQFDLPDGKGTDVAPLDLCGKKFLDRRIDGDLELSGIDNASLAWIADRGGGYSYVRQDRDGLGDAFRAAAARRYAWFELRYRMDPFYLRRSFRTRMRLLSFATAETSIVIHPSAWLDAPPGRRDETGWTVPQSFLHTMVLVMPTLGLLVAMSYLGASLFNTRRALFGRTRRPTRRATPKRGATPPPTAGPPPGSVGTPPGSAG